MLIFDWHETAVDNLADDADDGCCDESVKFCWAACRIANRVPWVCDIDMDTVMSEKKCNIKWLDETVKNWTHKSKCMYRKKDSCYLSHCYTYIVYHYKWT